IATFLQKPDAERTRILGTVNSHLKALMSREILQTLDRSSVALSDIVDEKPLSIYFILPHAKLRAHFGLLRLWLGTVLRCLMTRPSSHSPRTVVILDQCDQL